VAVLCFIHASCVYFGTYFFLTISSFLHSHLLMQAVQQEMKSAAIPTAGPVIRESEDGGGAAGMPSFTNLKVMRVHGDACSW
jgi:hypothetical protein